MACGPDQDAFQLGVWQFRWRRRQALTLPCHRINQLPHVLVVGNLHLVAQGCAECCGVLLDGSRCWDQCRARYGPANNAGPSILLIANRQPIVEFVQRVYVLFLD
ncbi:hypothetical protein D3C85_1484800 [compost metagenome]